MKPGGRSAFLLVPPLRCRPARAHRINNAQRLKEAAMAQKNSRSNILPVRSAVRAGAYSRVDQPDPPNRRQRKSVTRRLALAQFGVDAHGRPTFTRA
jgi:hypothetical protein